MIILAAVPAVVLGAICLLMLTGSTLNLQSYMGIIMSVGVSVANAVLLITNAEHLRKHNGDALASAKEAAALRRSSYYYDERCHGSRHVAYGGMAREGDQVSPLGRAVIGGLISSTFAVLIIYPGFRMGAGQSFYTIRFARS